MGATNVAVEVIPGNLAPRYNSTDTELQLEEIVITEQGMDSGMPLVDIVLLDESGNKYYTMVSGKIIQMLSSIVDGINIRNHGAAEPQ